MDTKQVAPPAGRGPKKKRDLRRTTPQEMIDAIFKEDDEGADPEQQSMLSQAMEDGLVERLVCDERLAKPQAAERLLKIFAEATPVADSKVLSYAIRHEGDIDMARVLKLLATISDGRRIQMTLMPYIGAKDARVRSQAALLIARGSRNSAFLSKLLADDDPRFRANVVEGFATWVEEPTLIRLAIEDSHHRVVTNGVLALYRLNPEEARQTLEQLAAYQDWRFRAAAAWAIFSLKDPALKTLADNLRADSHPNVRWNALRALRVLHSLNQDPALNLTDSPSLKLQ